MAKGGYTVVIVDQGYSRIAALFDGTTITARRVGTADTDDADMIRSVVRMAGYAVAEYVRNPNDPGVYALKVRSPGGRHRLVV